MSLDLVPIVNLKISNNAWWVDAFQFGVASDTSWSFTGKSFLLDVKANKDDTTPLLSLASMSNKIIVDDAAQRILHMNVTDVAIRAALPVLPDDGAYYYDLIMVDDGTGQRDALMLGTLEVEQGVTIED